MTSPDDTSPSTIIAPVLKSVAAFALLLFIALAARQSDFVHGDEAIYGKIARNIAIDPSHLLAPSAETQPTDDPAARDILPNTTAFFPMLLTPLNAVSEDPRALRLLSLLSWLVTAASAGVVGRILAGRDAGLWAAAFLLVAPSALFTFGMAVPEPVLAALGWSGLAVALSALPAKSGRLVAAGALWGLGFLVKLWLIGQILLLWVGVQMGRWLAGDRENWWRGWLFPAIGFAAVASLHALALSIALPDLAPELVRSVYLGFAGEKLSGAVMNPEDWLHPPHYYVGILFRDHWPVLMLSVAGLVAVWRSPPGLSLNRSVLIGMVGGFTVNMAAFSAIPAKHGLYLLPVTITLYVLAGLGARLLTSSSSVGRHGAVVITAGVSILTMAIALAWTTGVRRDELPLSTAIAMAASTTVIILALWVRRWPVAWTLAAILFLSAADEVRRAIAVPVLPYAKVSDRVAPYLSGDERPAFLGPNINVFEYYVAKEGRYLRQVGPGDWAGFHTRFASGDVPVVIELLGPGRNGAGRESIPPAEAERLRRTAGNVIEDPDLRPFRIYLSPAAKRFQLQKTHDASPRPVSPV